MSYQSKHTGAAIDTSVDTTQKILNMIYPVGSVYMSVNNVSPANFIGGTWERIQDRFLLAAGSSYGAGTSGGAASHTHTTAAIALTTAQMPAHTHTRGTMNITGEWNINSDSNNAGLDAQNTGTGAIGAKNSTGTGSSVAGTGWSTTTGFTFDASRSWTGATSSVGSGATHTHGNTGSSSNLPPYLSVYMWKRTA